MNAGAAKLKVSGIKVCHLGYDAYSVQHYQKIEIVNDQGNYDLFTEWITFFFGFTCRNLGKSGLRVSCLGLGKPYYIKHNNINTM